MAKLTLTDSVIQLKGIGPQQAQRLQRLHIQTVQDVLFHLPLRYQDRTRVVPLGALRQGSEAVVEVEVQLTEVSFGKRRSLLCRVADGTGSLTLRFFYFSNAQRQALERGVRLRCFGEARLGRGGLEMIHPEYRRITDDEPGAVDEHLTPFYPATEGIQQTKLRQLSDQVLALLNEPALLPEWLPSEVLQSLNLPALAESLHYVHRPPPDASVQELMDGLHPTQQRLAFEELLAHHLAFRRLRAKAQQERAIVIEVQGNLRQQCLANLPFQLTAAQQRVIQDIIDDIRKPYPAMRLVQGDVGSGKTLVAAMAVLDVIEAGYQVAFMAPTELLAEQHYQNFKQWLEPLGCQVNCLASKMKAKDRRATLSALETGETDVIVGTHALFQDEVNFYDLALLIVDEQHRFGVHQRLALRDKGVRPAATSDAMEDSLQAIQGQHPHQITMTATPIPRTLAMTAYADLDYSVIDELPPGRTPVKTVVISESRRDEVVTRIANACHAGQQAYWVCTLIEESDVLQCQAAEDTATLLAELLPELSIGLVHGRLKSAEKESIMRDFKEQRIDLLVATTVIEVGVDVPNASLMVIENAERLGLAQLHQLRGRVGRGRQASSCVLMYHSPLSERAKQRLEIMRNNSDGFEIAKQDLEMRGPGELLGTKQTGLIDFHIADISRDADLLPQVQATADLLQQKYADVVQPLIDRWLGDKQDFRRV